MQPFDVESIRREFPILSRKVYGKPLVYLDSGATAQKPQCVIDRVASLYRETNANVHRGVHLLSEEATEQFEAARAEIADFIGAAEKEEIVFTAGATASLNTVAYAWGERFVQAGDNLVVSEMEHHSNLVPWQLLAERKGAARAPRSACFPSMTRGVSVRNCFRRCSTGVRAWWP